MYKVSYNSVDTLDRLSIPTGLHGQESGDGGVVPPIEELLCIVNIGMNLTFNPPSGEIICSDLAVYPGPYTRPTFVS